MLFGFNGFDLRIRWRVSLRVTLVIPFAAAPLFVLSSPCIGEVRGSEGVFDGLGGKISVWCFDAGGWAKCVKRCGRVILWWCT